MRRRCGRIPEQSRPVEKKSSDLQKISLSVKQNVNLGVSLSLVATAAMAFSLEAQFGDTNPSTRSRLV
jgi:hypothetical protein